MAPRPGTGPGDRLGATLALSAILFGVLILGVGFALDRAAPVAPTLDVILTETRSEAPPEDADFIAQANNQGGGDSDRAERPREEQLAPVPKPDEGLAPEPLVAQAPPPEPEPVPRLLSTIGPSDQVLPAPEDQRETETEPLPTGQELVEQSLEMARLAAEIERRQQLLAKRPRRKFVSASTKEYEYAAYLAALNNFRVLIGQWLLAASPQDKPGPTLPQTIHFEDFELVGWRTLGEGMLLIDMYEQLSGREAGESGGAALDEARVARTAVESIIQVCRSMSP